MKIVLATLLLVVGASSLAAERNVMLLQQLQPAHIETVYVLERGDVAVIQVKGIGASTLERSAVTSLSEFNELWALANSVEVAGYKFQPSSDGNMADPAFVTITVGKGRKRSFLLKIPVEEHNSSAASLLSWLRRYLGKSAE